MRKLKIQAKDIQTGSLILVNAAHPLGREPGKDELAPVYGRGEEILLERQTTRALEKVLSLLDCNGEVIPVSGYRPRTEQEILYADSLAENGPDYTSKFVAVPGCSEHQTGLAVDMAENKEEIDPICPDFPYQGICQTFREKAVEYGFIERYPARRSNITKIAHEPWHFRYVGYPHSRIIQENRGTLEEYTAYLKQFQNKPLRLTCNGQAFSIYFVPLGQNPEVEIEIPEHVPCQISGNNEDGVIVSLWDIR